MAKMGRPVIEIDWNLFDSLCAIQCTAKEIAQVLKTSVDTLERNIRRKYKQTFAEHYDEKRQTGFASLRRKQYELAMGGNTVMCIWLGKQWLGQSDKQELNQSTEVKIKIETEDERL